MKDNPNGRNKATSVILSKILEHQAGNIGVPPGHYTPSSISRSIPKNDRVYGSVEPYQVDNLLVPYVRDGSVSKVDLISMDGGYCGTGYRINTIEMIKHEIGRLEKMFEEVSDESK